MARIALTYSVIIICLWGCARGSLRSFWRDTNTTGVKALHRSGGAVVKPPRRCPTCRTSLLLQKEVRGVPRSTFCWKLWRQEMVWKFHCNRFTYAIPRTSFAFLVIRVCWMKCLIVHILSCICLLFFFSCSCFFFHTRVKCLTQGRFR